MAQLWFERTSLSPHPGSCPSAPRGEEEGGAPRASPGPRPAGPGRAAADGDDVRLGKAHPVPGATAGDGGRGGAAAVPGAVLLLREHRGLSWAGAARRPEEHPPQHREAVSIPAGAAASAPRPPATVRSSAGWRGREVAPGAGPAWGPDALWRGVCVLFLCCRRCPFHSDACRHRRGGGDSQPLLFIPESRDEKRRSRGRGERERRGGHQRGPGRAPGAQAERPLPPPAPICRQTSLLQLSLPEVQGKSRAAAPRRAPKAQAGPGAGGGTPRARIAHACPAGRKGGRGRAVAPAALA